MIMTPVMQLHAVLQAELQSAKALLALLDSERDALTQSDIGSVNESNINKQPLIVQLEHLGRQREALLKNAGFASGSNGIEAFIANQPVKQEAMLSSLLGELRHTAKACREHNQINGGIVNVNRQYLQRALNILRGRDVEISAYGPGGEYTSQIVRQPLLGRV